MDILPSHTRSHHSPVHRIHRIPVHRIPVHGLFSVHRIFPVLRLLSALALVPMLVACGVDRAREADSDDGSDAGSAAAAIPAPAGAEDAASASEVGPGDALLDLPDPFGDRVADWGDLAGEREWGSVSAVHADATGERIWVAERCGQNSCLGSGVDPVLELDSAGNVTTRFGAERFVRPHGIFVDAQGNVWVADDQGTSAEDLQDPDMEPRGHQVIKFSPGGEVLLTLGTAGEPGDPPEHLTRPSDVVVAPNGDIFVAEGHSNDTPPARISRFSSTGTFIRSWGTLGSDPGQFRTAHALAFDSQGRLFVADRGNNRIQIFDQDGNFLDEWSQFGRPNDVYIEGDVLYTVDAQSDEETNPGMLRGVYVGSADTGAVTGFLPAEEDWEAAAAEGLATDAEGNLYLGHIGDGGMSKYTPR